MFLLYSLSFFNDTATTVIYTLSLHDALPIFDGQLQRGLLEAGLDRAPGQVHRSVEHCAQQVVLSLFAQRSEEHTSELQSHSDLVCRLLLEKKKKTLKYITE